MTKYIQKRILMPITNYFSKSAILHSNCQQESQLPEWFQSPYDQMFVTCKTIWLTLYFTLNDQLIKVVLARDSKLCLFDVHPWRLNPWVWASDWWQLQDLWQNLKEEYVYIYITHIILYCINKCLLQQDVMTYLLQHVSLLEDKNVTP